VPQHLVALLRAERLALAAQQLRQRRALATSSSASAVSALDCGVITKMT
jgi:hypothetical protein